MRRDLGCPGGTVVCCTVPGETQAASNACVMSSCSLASLAWFKALVCSISAMVAAALARRTYGCDEAGQGLEYGGGQRGPQGWVGVIDTPLTPLSPGASSCDTAHRR